MFTPGFLHGLYFAVVESSCLSAGLVLRFQLYVKPLSWAIILHTPPSASASHSLSLGPCSFNPRWNWQHAVSKLNSTVAILIPSTPTSGQLEPLAASDDGAIKRDIVALTDRWSRLCKPAPKPRPQTTRLTSTYSSLTNSRGTWRR